DLPQPFVQFGAAEGMRLYRQHMQPPRPGPILPPSVPQRQEVQPQPETGFAYGKGRPAAPTLRQAVAPQENVFGLPERARNVVIDIAIGGAAQAPVGA